CSLTRCCPRSPEQSIRGSSRQSTIDFEAGLRAVLRSSETCDVRQEARMKLGRDFAKLPRSLPKLFHNPHIPIYIDAGVVGTSFCAAAAAPPAQMQGER